MNPLLLQPGRRRARRSGAVRRLTFTALVAAFAATALLAVPARAADPEPSRPAAAASSGETGPVATPAHTTTTTSAAPAATTHGSGDAHKAEEVKLIPDPHAPQIITSIVTLVIFGLLVAILGKYAWGPIVSGLKAREDKIRKDIKDAEEARLRAERTLKDYQAQLATAEGQVRELIAKASADAQQIATSIRMNAQQEAEEAKERAAKEIEGAKNQALVEIYEQAANLATAVAEKILRRNLNADDQRELVRSSLEQLKGVEASAN